jgi:AraC-like DNA-binding protein
MRETLGAPDAGRCERLRGPRDSIRFGASTPGLQRAEVYLSAYAFEPHRHDTYAIGITTAGVQTFRYRGARRICLPGQLHVLHPDETHDGAAATGDGFGYRILYLAPELVREAAGGGELPFVADPVRQSATATRVLGCLLSDIDEPVSDLARAEIAGTLADMLRTLSGRPARRPVAIDVRAVEVARDYLTAHACEQTTASALEQITGADRFTLARHFRRAYGTSPDRYRTMRRLEFARTAVENGLPLAQVAAVTGFADQSHMTRQFKRTYGFTPARWRTLTAASPCPGTRA